MDADEGGGEGLGGRRPRPRRDGDSEFRGSTGGNGRKVLIGTDNRRFELGNNIGLSKTDTVTRSSIRTTVHTEKRWVGTDS